MMFGKDKAPCRHAFAIVPSDDTNLPHVTKEIYVGAGGHLCVLLEGDREHATFFCVPTGTTLRVAARRVLKCRSTATRLTGLY